MQQHIGDAQHVGKLLLFDAVDGRAVGGAIRGGNHLPVQLLQPAGDEAAGAAGKIRHLLADLRLDHLRHKIGDGAGRVKLTGGTGALQLPQDGFVDLPEGVAFLIIAKVDGVDLVDHLPQQHAVLHILVCVLKGGAHDGLFDGRIRRDLDAGDRFALVFCVAALQHRKQHVVDKVQQLVAGHGAAAFVIIGPMAPAAGLRDDGGVGLVLRRFHIPVGFLGVVYF